MGWRDRLLRASFRGVDFWVESTSSTKGRRVIVKLFAGRDGSEQQDCGRNPDELDVVAFLWGADYDLERRDLEDALTEAGPGALSHPTRGDLWVRITRGPITTEHKDEGGYCSIRFTAVVEETEGAGLRAEVDTRGALLTWNETASAQVQTDVRAGLDTSSLPETYVDKTLAAARSATDALRKAQRITQRVLDPVTSLTAEIAEFDNALNTVVSTPGLFVTSTIALVKKCLALPDTVQGGIDRATGLPMVLRTAFRADSPARMLDRASLLFHALGEPFTSLGESPSAARADNNARLTLTLFRAAALTATIDGYANASFDSATYALEVLARTLEEIDALCLLDPSDALFAALCNLRAALTEHMLETASRLPETIRYTPPREVPALVLAFDLYGDASMEQDIVARNRIAHPLFVSGQLEVLTP